MKKTQKILSALLALTLLFAFFIPFAGAANNTDENEIGFNGKISNPELIFAQYQGNILYPEGAGRLKRDNSSRTLNGFAVTPDEKYAFLGFTGSSAHRRSLEMIDLETGKAIDNARYTFTGTEESYVIKRVPLTEHTDLKYSSPRAPAVGDRNLLFVSLEMYGDAVNYGTSIGVTTYSDEGIGELLNIIPLYKGDVSEIAIKALCYKIIDGTAYLYAVTGDVFDDKDVEKDRDRIYRFKVTEENSLVLDETFGNNKGYSTVNDLNLFSLRNFNYNFAEIWSMDVAKDGTIYVSGTSNLGVGKIAPDGKTAEVWGNDVGIYNTKGGVVLLDNGKYLLVAENEVAKASDRELGYTAPRLQMYITATGEALPEEYAHRIAELNLAMVTRIVHMVNINGNIYMADRGNDSVTRNGINQAVDKVFKSKFIEKFDDIRLVGYQSTAADENGLYKTRFVAVVDTLTFASAGFKVTLTKAEGTKVEYTEEDFKETVVYEKLKSTEGDILPKDYDGKYFVIFVLPDFEETVTVDVKPYVEKQNGKAYTYGVEYSVILTVTKEEPSKKD